MPRRLIFVTSDLDRSALLRLAQADGASVLEVFEGPTPEEIKTEWARLLSVAETEVGLSSVRLKSVRCLPGGVWSWIRDLDRLAAIGLRLHSQEEPWLTLGTEQAQLLAFLSRAHREQRGDRIKEGLATAKGRGRPKVAVDIAAMAAYRQGHSLRATAAAFGIGTSTCHRILAKTGAKQPLKKGKDR